MRQAKLDSLVRGWFVGDFEPTLLRTRDVEAAVQHHAAGTREARHYHRIATEITVIVSGSATLNGVAYEAGDILVIEPGEAAEFHAVTDCVTAVVKIPGAVNDKYLVSDDEESPHA